MPQGSSDLQAMLADLQRRRRAQLDAILARSQNVPPAALPGIQQVPLQAGGGGGSGLQGLATLGGLAAGAQAGTGAASLGAATSAGAAAGGGAGAAGGILGYLAALI